MAIIKRPNGSYQVKYRGSDGHWISQTFPTKKEAEFAELKLKQDKRAGGVVTNNNRSVVLDEFFEEWMDAFRGQSSVGWQKLRVQQYRDFVKPILGTRRIQSVQPPDIGKVLAKMSEMGRAAQTRLHVYSLLRKLFRDAEESFRLVSFNPVLRSYKPQIPSKEAAHLNLDEVRKLFIHVKDKPYGDAIWLSFFLGLRVAELQALRWEDVDLNSKIVFIRRTYVRKERTFKDYPKGRKQHWKPIPAEAEDIFRRLKEGTESSALILRSPGHEMLSYEWYQRTLVRYCKELGIRRIGTHGLRHSTSALYLSSGATRDEIRVLLAHSSEKMTDQLRPFS